MPWPALGEAVPLPLPRVLGRCIAHLPRTAEGARKCSKRPFLSPRLDAGVEAEMG